MGDGTRAAGALQTREALLDAGAALAEEHGLAGVSVNMVVAPAGVAKGTFYVHVLRPRGDPGGPIRPWCYCSDYGRFVPTAAARA